ncbi:unnamed protein product [Mytilus coruscus]|uniref:Uncharacterized protein n=1 Tax=Mytilus coruscus TaxID=42192 RepID=A0A6J8E6Z6_MYTCO|nr:unnamed protein product [Mytilus coruscus]
MAGIWDDNELTQKENIETEELTHDEILTKEHIADNTLTEHTENTKMSAAETENRVKQSEDRIEQIFHGLMNIQAEQKEAMKTSSENIGAISQQVQQSEQRIEQKIDANGKRIEELTSDKFNALGRRLDKMAAANDEASTVQFKSAFEHPGSFQQMASSVSNLVNKRNKEVKLPSMETPVKQKVETSPYIASTSLLQNKPPAFGLSPIMSIDQTTQPESKAGAIPVSSAKGNVLGPSALHNTVLFQQPQGKGMPESIGSEQEIYHMQGSLPLLSDKGSVPGPSALHGTISGMVTQHPFKGIEGASTEYKPQHYTTPATATFASSYVGTPYVAQGIQVSTPLHVAPAASSESYAVSLVQSRPALYPHIGSMVQQPPPAFMTPGVLQMAGKLWGERQDRSPQPSKMQVFTGRGFLTWEAFIYQFERTAGRRQWENRKKVCRLLDCLADVALEYARKVNIDDDYKALRKALKQRFSKKDEPVSARRQLQYVRQQDNETLEEFAERVHFIAMDGYDKCNNSVIDQIGTEAFLRGCKDKEAARHVIERNPESINKALKIMKTSIANQKAIYGSRSPNFAHRQVSFADSAGKSHEKESTRTVNSPLEKEVRNLTQLVTKLTEVMLSSDQHTRGRFPERYTPPKNNAYRSPTPPPNQSSYNPQQRSYSPHQRSFSPQRQRSPSPRPNSRNQGYFKKRSPSPGDRAYPSSTPTTESLNANGSSR